MTGGPNPKPEVATKLDGATVSGRCRASGSR